MNRLKNQRGVTLGSLVIYIILVMIAIQILLVISTYFRTNMRVLSFDSAHEVEYSKFNLYFIREMKKIGNTAEIQDSGNSILFGSGNKFFYDATSKKIYLIETDNNNTEIKKVTISSNVTLCQFSKNQTDERLITVSLKIDENDTRTIEYVLTPRNPGIIENDYVYSSN